MSAFLAVDIGNSLVKAAVWDGAAWSETLRMPHDGAPERLEALARYGLSSGIASVVPASTTAVVAALRRATGAEPCVVSARLALPFDVAYRTPETLGPDRLAAAVAAWHLGGGRPVVALDAGTAVTLDAVDVRDGRPVYLGGAIAPGPDLMLRALARGTRALPDVTLTGPTVAIGASTVEAIQTGVSGLFYGGVSRLLEQTQRALTSPGLVVATGGWASFLTEKGLAIDQIDAALVLDGIRRLSPSPPG